jgi:hypothetical protein
MAARFVQGIANLKPRRLLWTLWLGLVACLALSLAVPGRLTHVDDAQQLKYDAPVALLRGDAPLSQSFTTAGDRLAGLALYIVDLPQHPVEIDFELRAGALPLAHRHVRLKGLAPPASFLVRFGELHGVAGKQLTLTLQGDPQDTGDAIVFGGTPWNSYPQGELAVGGQAAAGDLAFVAYAPATPGSLLRDGLVASTSYLRPLILLLLLWLACTIVVWLVLWPSPPERGVVLPAAASCSLLLVPLALLLTSLAGFRFAPPLLAAVALVVLIWRRPGQQTLISITPHGIFLAATVAVVAAFLLLVQNGLLRNAAVPLYTDSVHHTELGAAIAATGRVPSQFPGTQTPFFYHFGVHALAASLPLLDSAVNVEESFLVIGPVLLTACALGLYSLTRLAGGNHWAGLCAMVLTTFAFAMPTQLLDWGKYPLLFAVATGAGVLALALMAVQRRVEPLVAGLLLGGSVLAHTRGLAVWGAVLALALLVLLWRSRDIGASARMSARLMPGLVFVLVAWLLPAYWRWHQSGIQAAPLDIAAANSGSASYALYQYALPEMIWIVALAIGFLAMGSRLLGIRLAIVAGIVLLTLAAAFPVPFLPGQRAIDAQFAQAAGAIPLVLGLCLGVGSLQQLGRRAVGAPDWVPALVVAMIAIYAVSGRQSAPGLCCQIATSDDLAVIRTLADTVPASAVVGIAVARRPDGQAVGVDAGYWIEVLAHRTTTVPSLLYGFEEAGARSAKTARALEVDRLVRNGGELCRLGIDYVYLGQRPESFDRPTLENNPHLALVVREGASALYKIIGC